MTETQKCPTCGMPCRLVGMGDFGEQDVCTMHLEPVLEVQALNKPDGERPYPGDMLPIYRYRLDKFREIVGLADALMQEMAEMTMRRTCRAKMERLKRALYEHGNRYCYPDSLYIRDRAGNFHPCEPWDGFPATGVFLVYKGEDRPGYSASYRKIGDMPPETALTYAAAQVHYERAVKVLVEADLRNRGWSLGEVVDLVLKAIAEGEIEAQAKRETG